MSQTHCYICGRKLAVDQEKVDYMNVRYFTVCLNTQCDEYGAEVAEVSGSEWEPNDSQRVAGGI